MKKSLYTLALIVLFAGCNFPWGKSGKKKEAKEQVIHAALPTIDVKVITSLEDFEKEISNEKLSVVDFTAKWCGACQVFAPTFQKVANELGKEHNFIKVDVDKAKGAAEKYGVQGIPTVQFFRNGKKLSIKKIGVATNDELKELIKQASEEK